MKNKRNRITFFSRAFRFSIVPATLCRMCVLIWAPIIVDSATIPNTFNHFYSTDGLSNNSVRALAQDRNGFIWIGTEEGLNRYNGINFAVFKNSPDDPESLSSNRILALIFDSRGFGWIATDHGLNRWNPQTDRFSRFLFDADHSEKPGVNFLAMAVYR